MIVAAKTPATELPSCYVYLLFDELGQPFYVGHGSGPRIERHKTDANRYAWAMYAYYNDIIDRGFQVRAVKLYEEHPKSFAREIELVLVQKFGRRLDGGLVFNRDTQTGSLEARMFVADNRRRWQLPALVAQRA